MSGCLFSSISQSPSFISISPCFCFSLSLFCSHSLFFACCHIRFLIDSRPLIPTVCPLSSTHVWIFAFWIIGLQPHLQCLNHVLLCHCLLSAVPLPVSVCISLAPTVGLLTGCKYSCYIFILIAHLSQSPGRYFLPICFTVLAKKLQLLFGRVDH